MPGLASILQRLAMTDPLSVRTPPFMPSRVPIGLGGSVAAEDLGGIGVDPAEMPPDFPVEPPPRQQGPGVRQRLLGAVPGILRGAAIGLSMPSTGSGAMDAARAFVASGDDRDAQTMRQEQLNRQRAQDERQSILDSMRMEEHQADMGMLPIRRRMLESQAAENDAQAARNVAQANASTTPVVRPPQQVVSSEESYWAVQALNAPTPEARATAEANLAAIREAKARASAPRPPAPPQARPISPRVVGHMLVDQDEQGNPRSRAIPGLPPQAGRAVGRPGGGGRQMTPGQSRKAEVEDAANQVVREADTWIKQNKRADLNMFDLAISNLDKYFANDPRVARAKPEIVAQIRKLQAEMTNTGPRAKARGENWLNQLEGEDEKKPSQSSDQPKATLRYNPATGKLEPVR